MENITGYYCLPVWLSIIVHTLIDKGLAEKLKNRGKNEEGLYRFATGDIEETGREETLIVWKAMTGFEAIYDCEAPLLRLGGLDMLVGMAEEYARERNGREETKVHRCIIELIILIAVELYAVQHPGQTLVITGDFSLVGRLPSNGRLRIKGKVDRVEGSTGELLEVECAVCPELMFRGRTSRSNGVWRIERAPQTV